MTTYNITHKIRTLLYNEISSFTIQGIQFSQEKFSITNGPEGDYWLASGTIEAATGIDAINSFRKKLDPIVCALCLVGQAYTEYVTFSSLVTKPGCREALFFFHEEMNDGHNLTVFSIHVEAVKTLLSDTRDFSSFLKYWREITNTPDYIARLMLCCAAIDALTKELSNGDWEKEKHALRVKILGHSLKEKLYGNETHFKDARRHVLTHGEIRDDVDEINMTNEIRERIIAFFNKEVFKSEVMSNKIVDPWRNPYKNFVGLARVIRFKNGHVPLITLEKEFKEGNAQDLDRKSFTYLPANENNRLAIEF